jgi:hypothetical protein
VKKLIIYGRLDGDPCIMRDGKAWIFYGNMITSPILPRLAPYCRRRRAVDLNAMLRSAGAVERAQSLTDNALAAEPAGLLE